MRSTLCAGPWRVAAVLWALSLSLWGCQGGGEGTCLIERRGTPSVVVRISGSCQGADFSGLDLSQADVEALDWTGVTCPDGSSSAQNGGTCLGHLDPEATPALDMGAPDGASDLDQPDQDEIDQGPGVDMAPAPDLPTEDTGPQDMGEDMPPIDESGCQALGICEAICFWSQPAARATRRVTLEAVPGDWTLEAWVYLDEMPAEPLTIVSMDLPQNPVGRDLLALQVNRDDRPQSPLPQLQLQVGRGASAQLLQVDGAPFPLRRWIHVTVDSQYNVYLDGWSTRATQVLPQNASNAVDLRTLAGFSGWHIGQRGSATVWALPWNGALRGVRLSLGLRYQQNFPPPFPLEDNGSTLYLWPMDEGGGDTLFEPHSDLDIPIAEGTWNHCP